MNINRPSANIALPGLKRVEYSDDNITQRRLKALGWMGDTLRGHTVAMIGEFVGTFMFLFFAFSGTQVANTISPGATVADSPNTSNLLYIALSFGFSLAVNAWVFFRISGGLFNISVTFGMCLIGALGWVRGALVGLSQILGAIAAAAVVNALFPGPMDVQTTLGDGCSIARGLFIEMFLTAELVFTIFMLAAEKHRGTFIAPVGIGLALFVAELSGIYFTGGSLNPNRSFGPAVVAGQFPGYHWIYWLGPFLGSMLAVAFYKLVKALEYETVSPGADAARAPEEFGEDGPERQNTRIVGSAIVQDHELSGFRPNRSHNKPQEIV